MPWDLKVLCGGGNRSQPVRVSCGSTPSTRRLAPEMTQIPLSCTRTGPFAAALANDPPRRIYVCLDCRFYGPVCGLPHSGFAPQALPPVRRHPCSLDLNFSDMCDARAQFKCVHAYRSCPYIIGITGTYQWACAHEPDSVTHSNTNPFAAVASHHLF